MYSHVPNLPGYQDYIVYDAIHRPIYATLALDNCRITANSDTNFISEVIFPNSRIDLTPLFLLDIPYSDYRSSKETVTLPWQPATSLTHPKLYQQIQFSQDLYYFPIFDIIPVQPLSTSPLHFRQASETTASHFLVRTNWKIPDTAIADNSYNYERQLDRCNSAHTASVRQLYNTSLYYHVVSTRYCHGVDYWLLPS